MDKGHKQADEALAQLEKRLSAEYQLAYREIKEKADEYFLQFKREDKKMFRKMDKGYISRKDYLKWRSEQMAIGKRWENMIDSIARDYAKVNEIATALINNHIDGIFASNLNYGTYEIEYGAAVDTNYTLYNVDSVRELVVDNPQLLPKPDPTKVMSKNMRWNMQKVNSALLQGILQGDSIDTIALRLRNVTNMNKKASIRNARTMTTRAENAGRYYAYKRAESIGVKVQKQWIATLDGRTRHTHRMLDKETVDFDEDFSNGLAYPGDPDGAPSEVYNCRCVLQAIPSGIAGINKDTFTSVRQSNYLDNLGITYEDWLTEKDKKRKK